MDVSEVKLYKYEVEYMLRDLKKAVDVCYSATSMDDDDTEFDQTYPYATGYSRATMQGIINCLEKYT